LSVNIIFEFFLKIADLLIDKILNIIKNIALIKNKTQIKKKITKGHIIKNKIALGIINNNEKKVHSLLKYFK
jgi:hypothetical protein